MTTAATVDCGPPSMPSTKLWRSPSVHSAPRRRGLGRAGSPPRRTRSAGALGEGVRALTEEAPPGRRQAPTGGALLRASDVDRIGALEQRVITRGGRRSRLISRSVERGADPCRSGALPRLHPRHASRRPPTPRSTARRTAPPSPPASSALRAAGTRDDHVVGEPVEHLGDVCVDVLGRLRSRRSSSPAHDGTRPRAPREAGGGHRDSRKWIASLRLGSRLGTLARGLPRRRARGWPPRCCGPGRRGGSGCGGSRLDEPDAPQRCGAPLASRASPRAGRRRAPVPCRGAAGRCRDGSSVGRAVRCRRAGLQLGRVARRAADLAEQLLALRSSRATRRRAGPGPPGCGCRR